MPANEGYRRYIEAAAVLGQITRARAEELVRELMSSGDVKREHAQQWVDELMERSRKAAQDLVDLVRGEVSNQMQALGLDPDDLARQAADILRRSAEAGKRAARDMTGGAKKASAPAKSATKKSAGKKSTAKKSTAKKSTAKKSAAKKSTAKKSTTKKRATGAH